MQTIGQEKLWSFTTSGQCMTLDCDQIRLADTYQVSDYLELATKVAELQFRNPNYVLLFRGQSKRYKRHLRDLGRVTALVPSLFRGDGEENPLDGLIDRRFQQLRDAEQFLIETLDRKDSQYVERLERQRILRWAILQHYEVCPTPLLDVTHSLRIAASFASKAGLRRAYVFVLGVPNLSGAVTASAEAGLQIVRLASVCPPDAMRPHVQEGYLLGEYPELAVFGDKSHYRHHVVDFGRRLVAKFRFDPTTFWKDPAFPMVTQEAFYPGADPFKSMTDRVKSMISRGVV